MVRAGVAQSIAMSISGHKTVSMLMRYNITSGADKIDALDKTAAHLASEPTKSTTALLSKCRSERLPTEKTDTTRTGPLLRLSRSRLTR